MQPRCYPLVSNNPREKVEPCGQGLLLFLYAAIMRALLVVPTISCIHRRSYCMVSKLPQVGKGGGVLLMKSFF